MPGHQVGSFRKANYHPDHREFHHHGVRLCYKLASPVDAHRGNSTLLCSTSCPCALNHPYKSAVHSGVSPPILTGCASARPHLTGRVSSECLASEDSISALRNAQEYKSRGPLLGRRARGTAANGSMQADKLGVKGDVGEGIEGGSPLSRCMRMVSVQLGTLRVCLSPVLCIRSSTRTLVGAISIKGVAYKMQS